MLIPHQGQVGELLASNTYDHGCKNSIQCIGKLTPATFKRVSCWNRVCSLGECKTGLTFTLVNVIYQITASRERNHDHFNGYRKIFNKIQHCS